MPCEVYASPLMAPNLSWTFSPPVLLVTVALGGAYLRRWRMEVGVFFQGVGPDASDDELRRIAPGYPVFRITRPPGTAADTDGNN